MDSLKALVQTHCNASPDTTCINALLALSTHYITTAPDTALIYAEQGLQLAEMVNWQKGIGNAHHSVGHAYYLQGNFAQCLHHWNKALETLKQLASSPDDDIAMAARKGVSASLGNIGIVYWNQGNFPKALSYYFQALEMDSVMGNKIGIAFRLGNIGNVYNEQGNYPKALSYYFQALEMDSVMGNKKNIAIWLGNIGLVYDEQGDYPKALSYYFQALEMDSVMGNKIGIAFRLGNIGNVYNEQGDYAKALSYYFQALEMDSVMGNKRGIAIRLGNIGILYTTTKEYDKAEQYLKWSLAISDSIGALHHTMSVEKSISELFAQTNRWEKAYNHHILFSNAKDTVFGEEKTKAIGRVEMKHEMEMAEYLRQQEEKMVAATLAVAITRRNLLQYSLILLVLGGLFVAALYSRRLMAKLPNRMLSIKVIKSKVGFTFIFIFMVMLFESILLFADPYVSDYAQGAPGVTLLLNALLACILFPVNFLLEKVLREKLGIVKQTSSGGMGTMMGFVALMVFNSFTINNGVPDSLLTTSDLRLTTSKADSLITELSHSKTDTQKVKIFNALFLEHEFTDKEKAKEYLSQALNLSEKLVLNASEGTQLWRTAKKGLARTFTNLAFFAEDTGNYAQALMHHEQSLNISKESDDKKAIATTLSNIGIVYGNQGDYPKALSYHFQALEMDSVMENKSGIAIRLGNIGNVYIEQGNYPKALSYYFRSLEMDSVMGNKNRVAKHLGNIGIVYKEQSDYLRALSYYFQALEMDSVLGNKKGVATHFGNIGNVYNEQGDYPRALSYYFQALEIDSVMGNKKNIATHLGNIGILYTTIKEYDKAEQYLKRSLTISDSIGALYYTMSVEKSITKLYAQTNRWQKAYNHHLLYRIAKDTVFGEEKTKAIGRVEMKHEIEMAEYLRQQEEKMVAATLAATLARRNLLQYSAILIGFFVFLGGILLLSRLLLSRLHLPVWLIEFISFVPFLILFEFLLVLTETWLDGFTGGAPLYRLLFNGILAGLLYPLQQFSKTRMKRLFYTHTE